MGEVAGSHDVVVSATGPSRTGESHQAWLDAVSTLIAHAGEARILFVGGAGSLLTPDGTRLLDTDGFPAEYHAEASAGAAAPELFRTAPESVDWTFVSPAPAIAPGEDHAVALLDEIEEPQHPRKRSTAAAAMTSRSGCPGEAQSLRSRT